MIPQSIIKAALPLKASIGQEFDSGGKHVAYWYRVPDSDWKVYRHSVAGMLALLRHVNRAQTRYNKAAA